MALSFIKRLNSEINDFALSEALGAIQKRVELPFFTITTTYSVNECNWIK